MITIGANGERIAYGIKHYNLDTEADLQKLGTKGHYVGSTCFVIATSKYYMFNGSHEWIEIFPFGQAASEGSGEGPGETPDIDPGNDDVIYDGGQIL